MFLLLAVATDWTVIDTATQVLSVAFVVILMLNAGAPVWMVAASGVLIGLVGHFVISAVHDRLVGSTSRRRGVALGG